jgi:hypothetical protein
MILIDGRLRRLLSLLCPWDDVERSFLCPVRGFLAFKLPSPFSIKVSSIRFVHLVAQRDYAHAF